MKNLHLILRKGSNKTTFDLLKRSAEQKGIHVIAIYTEDFDYTKQPPLSEQDALYRLSTDAESARIEKVLINQQVISFYHSFTRPIASYHLGSSLLHSKIGLNIIPTIFTLPRNREQSQRYVESLGGFPFILKAMGGMHGVGVMKIDSSDSLHSILDYIRNQSESIILRKFIHHHEQARMIVLGDNVIAHHTNLTNEDFRTNAGSNKSRRRIVKEYDEQIKKMAVEAVRSLEYDFGGVDILFEEGTNIPYIAEVNSPCFFPTTQRLTNVDISGQMIDFLINKSLNNA